VRAIARSFGARPIRMTMRYLHYVPAHDDAARLTAAFTSESGHRDGHPTADRHA
jgi:hypothetical protein